MFSSASVGDRRNGGTAIEETRRSLLAKAGLAGGVVGLAALLGTDSALALGQELEGFLNVTDPPYDAKNDGTDYTSPTERNASRIQRAINDAADDKAAVYFPPGTYALNQPIRVKSGTTLLGVGRPVVKAHADLAAGQRLIEVSTWTAGGDGNFASSDVTLQGIVFDGNDRSNTSDFLALFYSIDRFSVIDCEFRNYQYGLLGVGGCRSVTLRGLRFRDWGSETQTAGPALWVAGSLADNNPTSRVRGYDLDFQHGQWSAMYIFCRDFVFDNVTIEDVKEGGIYTTGAGHLGTPANQSTENGVFSNFRINGVGRMDIAASGFEGGGFNIALRNFTINDTDDAGVRVNWPAEDVTIENGQIWNSVRQQATYSTFTNYGQVTLLQQTGFTFKNVTVRDVTIGKPGVTPLARYAVSVIGLGPEVMQNIVLWPNDTRYGGTLKPVWFSPAGVAPSAAPANADYTTYKVFSDTEAVELLAQTFKDGKNAAVEIRGRESNGNEVRAEITARSAPDVLVGSTSNHELVFMRNNQEVFRINSADNLVIKDNRHIKLGTAGGTKIGMSAAEMLGFYNKAPIARPSALTARNTAAFGTGSNWTTNDRAIVSNMRTRLNELEDRLNSSAGGLGLIA
jgi:hypothetical protein